MLENKMFGGATYAENDNIYVLRVVNKLSGEAICNAVLISEYEALTVAHCIKTYELEGRVRNYKIKVLFNDGKGTISNHLISYLKTHKDHRGTSVLGYEHDIGYIRVSIYICGEKRSS